MMAITIFIVSLPQLWPALIRSRLGNFDPAGQWILADAGAFAAAEQSSLVPVSGTVHAVGENRSFLAGCRPGRYRPATCGQHRGDGIGHIA
jgi:hypothetical protein